MPMTMVWVMIRNAIKMCRNRGRCVRSMNDPFTMADAHDYTKENIQHTGYYRTIILEYQVFASRLTNCFHNAKQGHACLPW